MKTYTIFETCSASEYYDAIINKVSVDSEAVYYLLTKRLAPALRQVYDNNGHGLPDDFDDTIDDFFLYLYEGNPNGNLKPFAMLNNIRNKNAFFGWVLSTYRNYLLKRVREEEKRRNFGNNLILESHPQSNQLSDETMMCFLASAIAYVDQSFNSRNRFIFYRMMLTFLDHRMAVPQEQMAKVLGMHPVTYRVSTKRQKERFLRLVNDQETGRKLELDVRHCNMRDQVMKGFNKLYEVLLQFYDTTVNEMPMAVEIKALRRYYSSSDELMMHEGNLEYGYRYKVDVRQLYMNIKTGWTLD